MSTSSRIRSTDSRAASARPASSVVRGQHDMTLVSQPARQQVPVDLLVVDHQDRAAPDGQIPRGSPRAPSAGALVAASACQRSVLPRHRGARDTACSMLSLNSREPHGGGVNTPQVGADRSAFMLLNQQIGQALHGRERCVKGVAQPYGAERDIVANQLRRIERLDDDAQELMPGLDHALEIVALSTVREAPSSSSRSWP